MFLRYTAIIIFLIVAVAISYGKDKNYCWFNRYDSSTAICKKIKVPESFVRVDTKPKTFANWLQHLPVRIGQTDIYNYKKQKVTYPDASYAIVDIDIGGQNLMQCADAIIRFRAEYLYSRKIYDSIAFNFTSGHKVKYIDWMNGIRPVIDGNQVEFVKSENIDSTYSGFREYLNTIFMYAGTHSLSKELKSVSSFDNIQIGDALILPGFPGHAVLVTDMAVDTISHKKMILLTQGFMPAQDVHIVKNPRMPNDAPWFEIDHGDTLEILSWKFTEKNLCRF